MSARHRIALAAALLLALGLRLWRLDYKSLWLDEACTWEYAKKPFTECVTSEVSNPPGSFAISWVALRVLGDSERGLRLPSALSGVLATWLLFRLGRRLFDEPTATVAAFLFAASAFNLRFTQEARTYGFLACAVLASMEALVMLLERPTWARAAYYVVAAAAGLHFHYVFGFVILSHNAVVAWSRWVRGRRELTFAAWAGVQAAVALLFAPWFLFLWEHRVPVNTSYIDRPWGRVVTMFFAFTWGFPRLNLRAGKVLDEAVRDHWHLIMPYLLVVLLAVRGVRVAARQREAGPVLGMLLGVPLAIGLGLATAGSVRFTDERYLGFLLPVWVLLVAAALLSLPGRWERLLAWGVVVGSTTYALWYYDRMPQICNEDWRGAARYVMERRREGDLVLIHMPYMRFVYEYYDRSGKELVPIPEAKDETPGFARELGERIKGRRRVWLLLGHVPVGDSMTWPIRLHAWLTPVGEARRFPSPYGDPQVWEFAPR